MSKRENTYKYAYDHDQGMMTKDENVDKPCRQFGATYQQLCHQTRIAATEIHLVSIKTCGSETV